MNNFQISCIKCQLGQKLAWSTMVMMWEGFCLIFSKWLGFQHDIILQIFSWKDGCSSTCLSMELLILKQIEHTHILYFFMA